MPTEAQEDRKLLHTRRVTCRGYARADGLWDVEGELDDVRTVDCLSLRGQVLVAAGDTLHGMRLRITLDGAMRIVAARALTESSPHGDCRAASAGYAALVGLTIGPGFLSAARARFRGINGCTHLSELIGPVATTAVQTVFAGREQALRGGAGAAAPRKEGAAALVDSCHSWRRGGAAFLAHYPGAADD